jgi:hypothetical protein
MPSENNLRPQKQMPRNADTGKRRLNFTKRHGRDAEKHIMERDNPLWDTYYNTDLKALKRKTGSVVIGGKRWSARDVYVNAYKHGQLKPTSGYLFDTGKGRLVKKRALVKGESLNGDVIYNGEYTNSADIPTTEVNAFQSGDYTMTLEFYGEASEERRNCPKGSDDRLKNHKNTVTVSLVRGTGFAGTGGKVVMDANFTLLCNPVLLNISAANLAKMHKKPYIVVDPGGNQYYAGSEDYHLLLRLVQSREGVSLLEGESHDRIDLIKITHIDANANPVNQAPADQPLSASLAPQILSNKYIPLTFDGVTFKSNLPMCEEDDCVPQTFKQWMEDELKIENFVPTFLKVLDHEYSKTMTLTDVIPFLKMHRLKLTALNIAGERIFFWEPAIAGLSDNKHVTGLHLIVVAHNAHIYALNGVDAPARSYNSLVRTKFREVTEPKTPPQTFTAPEKTSYDAYAETTTELFDLFKSNAWHEQKVVRIGFCGGSRRQHCPGDLTRMQRLLLRFRKEHSLEPSLFVRKNTIKAMTLWLEKTRVTICNVPVRKQPKEFNDWMNKFKRAIFTEDLKSAYSPNFRIAFSEMRMPQLCARFITDVPDYALGVDVARCYPAAVMMEKTIPVLLHTDDFIPYDGHTIQDDYYYYFENDDRWSIDKWFICKRRFGVRKGFVLNRCGLTFHILGFCMPRNSMTTHFRLLSRTSTKLR